ncbi:DUF2199 domain-containing protein [Hymenobacter coccineus]|uniref:DUF2199 domain-containing protein n=1 Tax=Hymenobacter coccineus TaxID=1908235 RepID=A0A1G1SV79_9BACT|nr:DUF2199 domain-containing protein [Hymenobacter coccineus]OGX82518.1 hypothetical protein BEN49_13715 [Hymenobacter coccineus]
MQGFTCSRCGEFHEEMPLCFGAEFPDYYFSVPPEERADRVECTESLCVVDEAYFFIRGRVEIPIVDSAEVFCWNVWVSVSEENFLRTNERWNDLDRENEPAYFGWFQTVLPGYPDTLNIKAVAYTQKVGIIPQIEVIDEAHLLAVEQRQGITWQRVHELVEAAMHD